MALENKQNNAFFSPSRIELVGEPSRLPGGVFDPDSFRTKTNMHLILHPRMLAAHGVNCMFVEHRLLEFSWGGKNHTKRLLFEIEVIPNEKLEELRYLIHTVEFRRFDKKENCLLAIGYFRSDEDGAPLLYFRKLEIINGTIKASSGICPAEPWIVERYHNELRKEGGFKLVPNVTNHRAYLARLSDFGELDEHLEQRILLFTVVKAKIDQTKPKLFNYLGHLKMIQIYYKYYKRRLMGAYPEKHNDILLFEKTMGPGRTDVDMFTISAKCSFEKELRLLVKEVGSKVACFCNSFNKKFSEKDWKDNLRVLVKEREQARELSKTDVDLAMRKLEQLCLLSGSMMQDLLRLLDPLNKFQAQQKLDPDWCFVDRWRRLMTFDFEYVSEIILSRRNSDPDPLDDKFDWTVLLPEWKRAEMNRQD
jgi:hypothetical protein